MPLGSKFSLKQNASFALVLILIAIVLISVPEKANAQYDPDLIITVGDTTGSSGEQNSAVSVFLTNWEDSITAFTLWLKLNKPNVAFFQLDTMTVIDTTYWVCEDYDGEICVDSVAGNPDTLYWRCIEYDEFDDCVDFIMINEGDFNICGGDSCFMQLPDTIDMTYIDTVLAEIGNMDTVGTLMGGWEYIETRSYSGDSTDVLITAFADIQEIPGLGPIIPPTQTGSDLLFRLMADIREVADTASLEDRTVYINVQKYALQYFIFSRPDGTAIGINNKVVPDSNMFRCVSWAGGDPGSGICITYDRVTTPPYDSVEYITDTAAYLDTNVVYIDDGTIIVTVGCCNGVTGNVNCSELEEPDVSDIVRLIDFLYLSRNPLCCPEEANTNGSVEPDPDISDIVRIIDYLYINHTACATCP